MGIRCTLLSLSLVWVVVHSTRAADEPPARVDFTRDIQPLLAEHCYACHGPDEQQRQSGLRLDLALSATQPAESGAVAIIPGQPAQSELIRRVLSGDDSLRMPPPEAQKSLTSAQKELLRDWVAQGAEYQTLWSFRPLSRPAPPEVDQADWVRTPIDRFVLARLTSANLVPASEATRETLIRRLTFDLTGLPPTLAEIDAFVTAESVDAYEKLIDRLLASPHYGERLALDWLDAARFADTNGYHLDNGRDMTRWRAWVIEAFNHNLPFDQFTIEQLAGDLLPNATLGQQVASGFHRNHMINFEGGAIPAEYHNAYIVDRVNTTSTVWFGLTIACAQCHDHKYDPITQKDFYSLYAFFHNVPENGLDGNQGNAMPLVRVPTAEQAAELAELDQRIAELVSRTSGPLPAIDQAQQAWEAAVLAQSTQKQATELVELSSWYAVGPMRHPEGGQRAFNRDLGPEGKAVDLQASYFLDGQTYRWSEQPNWIDGKIINLPGEQAATYLYRTIRAPSAQRVQVSLGSDDALKVWLNRKQILSTDTPRAAAPDQNIVTLDLQAGDNQLLMKVVNYFGDYGYFFALQPETVAVVPENVLTIVKLPTAQRTAEQTVELRDYYRNSICRDPLWKESVETLATLRKQRAEVEQASPSSMVMREMPQPRETFVLVRGEYDKPAEKVVAAVPASLPPLSPELPANRLGLAHWLTAPEHPLTARVIANRYWQMLFGTGLVETSEDFGSRGELPSHPELLDWLAVELQSSSRPDLAETAEAKWNLKAFLKLLVMSATYRQDSQVTPAQWQRDPTNRWLSRGPRVRLPAEFIRDQALAVSGLLKHRIGGPSVSPYQPAGLWEELSSRGDSSKWTAQVFEQSTGDDLYRRSMYTFWKRTSPPPQMLAFDAPDRETCTVRRARTNTPLQALILMNDPTYIEAARKLAERVLSEAGATDEQRLTFAFRVVTGRRPKPAEEDVLREVLREQIKLYDDRPDAAEQLLSNGAAAADRQFDSRELAAWTILSSVLLNLDETVTKS